MSIFFEIDGPYKAMIIPAAREEGKKLKKRYGVFNFSDQLVELKGFELKRRGELQIVKEFQKDIFKQILRGSNLQEIYEACAETCKKFIDIIRSRGNNMSDEQVVHFLGQQKILAKKVDEYQKQKIMTVVAVKRLAQFLGEDFLQGSGISCNFIIGKSGRKDDKLTDRVVPTLVFKVKESLKTSLLEEWLGHSDLKEATVKQIIDWDYYLERFSFIIQKIIIIPAVLQGISNPLPDIQVPK